MTKPFIVVIGAIALIFISTCATTGSGAGLSLMDAIGQTGEKIAGELPKGSRVAIVAFESVNDNLSDYIMEELTGELFDRGIEVADRQNLEYVYKELNLQMSGDVSDESAKSIGKFLAADMVITGQLIDLDGAYRYRTSAINVETAVRASVTRLDVRSDNATRRMINAIANQQTTTKVAKYGVSENSTPQTAGTFLDRGMMFANRGDYELAIADYNEALRLEPNLSYAYILRGIAYREMKNIRDAFYSFVQAVELNPNDAEVYVWLGLVLQDMGELNDAIMVFSQAIRLNPNIARYYFFRGSAYVFKGDINSGIADLDQSIRLEPNVARDYFARGLAYQTIGDLDRAIADYRTALRFAQNDQDLPRPRRDLEKLIEELMRTQNRH
jgi:tetratricopeptide (TPR) repeat protein